MQICLLSCSWISRGCAAARVSGAPAVGGAALIEIVIIAVSKLGSLCDRTISGLSHSSLRSAHVTANANTLTAAQSRTLDYARCRGADPGRVHQQLKKHEIIFLLFNYFPFWASVWVPVSIAAGRGDANLRPERSEGGGI